MKLTLCIIFDDLYVLYIIYILPFPHKISSLLFNPMINLDDYQIERWRLLLEYPNWGENQHPVNAHVSGSLGTEPPHLVGPWHVSCYHAYVALVAMYDTFLLCLSINGYYKQRYLIAFVYSRTSSSSSSSSLYKVSVSRFFFFFFSCIYGVDIP